MYCVRNRAFGLDRNVLHKDGREIIAMSRDKRDKNRRYVGGSDANVLEPDERDLAVAKELDMEKKRRAVIVLCAVVISIIAVSVYFAVTGAGASRQSRKLVQTYMEGLNEGDVEKVKSVMDPDIADDSAMSAMINIFKTYKEQNIEYTVSYKLEDGREATENDIESVSSTLYGMSAKRTAVTDGYVIPVKGQVVLTYEGHSSPYELDMDIICYKKAGKWYLAGTIEN